MMRKLIKYDSIIFDFDGVLVDSIAIKNNAFAEIYRQYGEDIEKKVIEFNKKNSGISRFDKFKFFHKKYLNKKLSANDLAILCLKFSNIVEDKVISAPLMLGAIKFFEENYKHANFHIASATPEDELKRIIANKNLNKYFLTVCGSPKVKTKILQEINALHSYKPENVLMLGDSLHDYESAIAAKIQFHGFLGTSLNNPFPSFVQTITSFEELPKLIRAFNNE